MGRTPCCQKADTIKGAWSKEEDEALIAYIRDSGEGGWRSLPKAAGLQRCGKSCRLRWINYLRPDLKRGSFSPEEDKLIIELHCMLGNKWSLIASRLPGRTDNDVKNYWNTRIKRRMLERGVDPCTHLPLKPGHGSIDSCSEYHVLPKRPCKPKRRNKANDVLTDFFQQQGPRTLSEQKIISRSDDHADDQDVNLDLSITLPSFCSSQGASNDFKVLPSGIRPSNDGIQQDHKKEM